MGTTVPAPHPELDPELIQRALGRESSSTLARTQAFRRLHEHYEPCVRIAVGRAAMIARYTHRIEDLRQEVWCRFAQPRSVLHYYDPSRGAFGPFLSRVAYQQALSVIHQDRHHTSETAQSESYEDDVEDPRMARVFALLIQTDFFDALMERARAELSSTELAMLELIYFRSRSVLSIAPELGINGNTIHKYHQRLKRKLRGWAQELLDQADPKRPRSGLAVVLSLLAGLAVASGTSPLGLEGNDLERGSSYGVP